MLWAIHLQTGRANQVIHLVVVAVIIRLRASKGIPGPCKGRGFIITSLAVHTLPRQASLRVVERNGPGCDLDGGAAAVDRIMAVIVRRRVQRIQLLEDRCSSPWIGGRLARFERDGRARIVVGHQTGQAPGFHVGGLVRRGIGFKHGFCGFVIGVRNG